MILNIPVVLGSVREGRRSIYPAKLLVEKLRDKGVETQLVDFKDLPLPFFDSPLVPVALKGNYPYPNVQKWSGVARVADAFVFVTPEYNHGYPAVLKNALDWLYLEFEKKPAGLVGVSDGSFAAARAIEQLRPVLENFSMFGIRETLMFGKVQETFDQQGRLLDESYLKKIESFLTSLLFAARAMKQARENGLSPVKE